MQAKDRTPNFPAVTKSSVLLGLIGGMGIASMAVSPYEVAPTLVWPVLCKEACMSKEGTNAPSTAGAPTDSKGMKKIGTVKTICEIEFRIRYGGLKAGSHSRGPIMI